jgi:hypothetical protein
MRDNNDIELPDHLQLPDRIERLRDALLPDGAFEGELAAALGCSRRKVQQLGLPFDKIGGTRIYNIPGSRQALRRRPPSETALADAAGES